MKAEILAIGTELLMGETADTNSGWLAQRLPGVGLELCWVTVVGDDLQQLIDVLTRAWDRSDYIFTIGGLGPTEDDLTRNAISALLEEPLVPDPYLTEWLEERFRSRGMPMPINNLRQATTIASASPVMNTLGTAPGWWVERDGRTIITMPGPPNEFTEMWNGQCSPRLQELEIGSVILTRTYKTIGLSEAAVDEMVKDLYQLDNIDLGCYAKNDGIYLRAITKSADRNASEIILDDIDVKMRKILGFHLWGIDDETPQDRAGVLISQLGLTLAVAESCTGGHLAAAISDVPGSSSYFKGALVPYRNESKISTGVDSRIIERFGVISEECAIALARSARDFFNADIGIGVTGVAGPSQQEEKPVGLVYIAIDVDGSAVNITRHQFPGRRPLIRGRAVTMALLQLCQILSGRSNAG